MIRIVTTILTMALATLFALTPAGAGQGGRLRERLMQRMQGKPDAPVPGREEMAYGTDPLQRLDFWRATPARGPAPLIVFVHGGGWKRGDKANATGTTKVAHYLSLGYAVASIDYRLVPANGVEQQAQDVADAVAWLRAQAVRLGADPRDIVLMGHSAGAHLAALVGTDMRYFTKAGLAPDAVRGIVLLDGAAYDVPRQIADGGNVMHDSYLEAFGTDPARQQALSPTFHAASPNAPDFLILHIARDDGTAQSIALGAALRQAGTPAEVRGVEGTGLAGHAAINRKLGSPDYPATAIVDAYIARRLLR